MSRRRQASGAHRVAEHDAPSPPENAPPQRRGEESYTDLAHALAERVRACPDVADLAAGPFGTIATYLPGGKVSGVAVRPGEVEIAIVARYGRPLPQIAEEIRDAVAPLTGDRRVHIVVADVTVATSATPA